MLVATIAIAAFPRSSEASCEDWETYYDRWTCPSDWSCLELIDFNGDSDEPDYQWDEDCNPVGVQLRIRTSNVTLDCAGGGMQSYYDWQFPSGSGNAVYVGGGTVTFGENFNTASCDEMGPEGAFVEYEDAGFDVYSEDSKLLGESTTTCRVSRPTQNVKIANCSIRGYTHGVVIAHSQGWAQATKDRIIAEYERWYRDPKERVCRVTQIEDCYRASAPRDIEIDNVHVRHSAKNGVHVRSYVQDVNFHHGSVRDTRGSDPGIYLTYGSRRTTIGHSVLAGNNREGIAIDASADNRIHNNVISDNDDAGITLFRNAWEGRDRDNPSAPRAQHASGNRIERNEIRGHPVGIWIGYRQDTGPPSERGDPVYFDGGDKYYRHNAEDTTVSFNTISDTASAIIIDDDRATVVGNWITLPSTQGWPVPAATGISLGSWVRRRASDPVFQSIISGNVFVGADSSNTPIRVQDCAVDSVVEDNMLFNGAFDPVGPDVGSCDRARMRLRFHRTRADATYALASGHQQGGPFGRARDWLVGDFNDDTIDDLLHVYISDDNQVRLWLHAGTEDGFEYRSNFQTFHLGEMLGIGSSWVNAAVVAAAADDVEAHMVGLVGDFDGRRGDDLALVITEDGSTASTALVWHARGSGFRFSGLWDLAPDRSATEAVWMVGDVAEGASIDELILAYRTPADDAIVEVYRADAVTFTRRSVQTIGVWSEGQAWVSGDWDNDGRDDLASMFSVGFGVSLVALHHANGTDFDPSSWMGYLNDAGTGEVPLSERDRWLATDFDGDGDDDLVRVAALGDVARVSRYRSAGDSLSFVSTDTLGSFHDEQAWLAGDFDCGSREEIVVLEGLGDWGAYAPMADSGPKAICEIDTDPSVLPTDPSVGRTADIVWQSGDGQMHYWSMVDGQRLDGYNVYTPVVPAWVPLAVGDVDGDGFDDIIFQRDNGQVHCWRIRDGERVDAFDIYVPVSSDWSLRGAGDVDGDGTDDIIWQHSSGQVHYWPMHQGQRLSGYNIFSPVSSDWSLRGVGDVDGDGTDDIIWQHWSGQVHYWPMRQGQRLSGYNIGSPVSSAWSLRAAGDVDGDGTDDIIWQRPDGRVHYWSMWEGQADGAYDVQAPVGDDWMLVGAGKMDGGGSLLSEVVSDERR